MSLLIFAFSTSSPVLAAPETLPIAPPTEAPAQRKPKSRPAKPRPVPHKPMPAPTKPHTPTRVQGAPVARPAKPDFRHGPVRPAPATTITRPERVDTTPKPSSRPATKELPPVKRPEVTRTPTAVTRDKLVQRPKVETTRPYESRPGPVRNAPPPNHRYARPHPSRLHRHPRAPAPPPTVYVYRPWYSHWWVHPYYRYTHVTWVVVGFPFVVHAWDPVWSPPPRPGWVWVPGYWAFGWWHPGYWRPMRQVVVHVNAPYVYVPGWWYGDIYIEGYYRRSGRPGWVWVDGEYADGGFYVPGHWRPAGVAPEGYVWEPGFFDGTTWVEGFWRPSAIQGFVWRPRHYDEDGLLQCGYWEPTDPNPGHVWIPGWFDGNTWQRGQWVPEKEYAEADIEAWKPEDGWSDGWDEEPEVASEPDDAPLAMPVEAMGE